MLSKAKLCSILQFYQWEFAMNTQKIVLVVERDTGLHGIFQDVLTNHEVIGVNMLSLVDKIIVTLGQGNFAAIFWAGILHDGESPEKIREVLAKYPQLSMCLCVAMSGDYNIRMEQMRAGCNAELDKSNLVAFLENNFRLAA